MEELRAADDGVQFSHTIEEQVGGQLEAGFVLTGLYEDTNGYGRLHEIADSLFRGDPGGLNRNEKEALSILGRRGSAFLIAYAGINWFFSAE